MPAGNSGRVGLARQRQRVRQGVADAVIIHIHLRAPLLDRDAILDGALQFARSPPMPLLPPRRRQFVSRQVISQRRLRRCPGICRSPGLHASGQRQAADQHGGQEGRAPASCEIVRGDALLFGKMNGCHFSARWSVAQQPRNCQRLVRGGDAIQHRSLSASWRRSSTRSGWEQDHPSLRRSARGSVASHWRGVRMRMPKGFLNTARSGSAQ